jgi:hypothetical protein
MINSHLNNKGAHVEYTNNICWITKSFYVPVDTKFTWSSTTPSSPTKYLTSDDLQLKNYPNTSHLKFAKVDNLIAYYPFLLIIQAILFYIPYFFWKNIINRSAYDISTLVYIAYDSQYCETQSMREKSLRYLIKHIDRANDYYGAKKKANRYISASGSAHNRRQMNRNMRSNLSTFGTSSHVPTTSGASSRNSWASNIDKRYKTHHPHHSHVRQQYHHRGISVGTSDKSNNVEMDNQIIDLEKANMESNKLNRNDQSDVFEKINKSSSFLRMFENFSFYSLRKRLKLFEKGDDDEDDDDNDLDRSKSNMNIKVNDEYPDEDENEQEKQACGNTSLSRNGYYYDTNTTSSNKFYSKTLFTVYMIVKFLYILNCIGQFLLLNKFIAGETRGPPNFEPTTTTTTSATNNFNLNQEFNFNIFGSSGINIINSNNFINENNNFVRNELTFMIDRSFWKGFEFGYKSIANLIESGNLFGEKSRLLIFHTVIFCDFKIRMLGDRLHRHTVQCVVPVNIYTEKMFTVLWFWFLILNFINTYDFIKWLRYYLSYKVRYDFIVKHLLKVNDSITTSYLYNNSLASKKSNCFSSSSSDTKESSIIDCGFMSKTTTSTDLAAGLSIKDESNLKLINSMIKTYLMHDNVFIVKLISKNTNEMTTRELVTLLLDNFKRKTRLFDENTV